MTDQPADAPAAPLRPQSLTARVVERLTGEIEGGRLAPGAQLPTQEELMRELGVSRTVVREAVAALRAAGLVSTHQGRGAFVTIGARRQPFRVAPEELRSLEEVLKIMELRRALEVEAAGLAARRRAAGDLQAMTAALARFDQRIVEGGAAIEADLDFHFAVAQGSGNGYFERLLRTLADVLIPRRRVRIGMEEPTERQRYLTRVQGEHYAILDAVTARDEAAARAAMQAHLENSAKRYRHLMRQARG